MAIVAQTTSPRMPHNSPRCWCLTHRLKQDSSFENDRSGAEGWSAHGWKELGRLGKDSYGQESTKKFNNCEDDLLTRGKWTCCVDSQRPLLTVKHMSIGLYKFQYVSVIFNRKL
ncbi:hypothetical protein EYF80_061318 [Liparis tanakae]|uniref:Uncharacterized protein n=1 Tax=Liparis tanakae TaxID=230148 RepID=A0A4Z2EJC9_9TELE|nr:hypothetical protein EYF80_061318 [Liparis tanakae]